MPSEMIELFSETTQDTTRGPSTSLWADSHQLQVGADGKYGYQFFDDFVMVAEPVLTSNIGSMGQWGAYVGANGVLDTDPALEGGVIALSSGANSGVVINLASVAGAFRMLTTSTLLLNKKLWFECRVAVGSITTAKRDCFIGLCDNTANIVGAANTVIGSSTNTLATAPNLFGFHFRSTTNPTDVGLAYNVAGGTVQYPTNLQTLSNTVTGAALAAYTAGTGFIKLGFKFDPDAQLKLISSATGLQTAGTRRRQTIKVYVNGQVAAAFLNATDDIAVATFPTGFMCPTIAFESRSASSPGDFYIDWIKVRQFASDQW